MNLIIEFDHWLFHKINQDWANPFFDWCMPFITDFHHRGWIWIVLMVLLNSYWIYHNRQKVIRVIIASVLAFAFADSISYRVIKPLVNRDRPAKAGVEVTLRVDKASGQSFPSNHASNSFAVATVVGTYFPAVRWWALAYAAAVAYSRVYVGVHFPGDVAAGALLGSLISLFVLWMIKLIESKIKARAT
jgi:undecaprenyl-diphosphatase